jgi:hypothetical protein
MTNISSYNTVTAIPSPSALDLGTGPDPQAEDNPDSNSRPGNAGIWARRLSTVAAAALVGLVANPTLTWAQELFVAMSNGSTAFESSPPLPNDFCLEGEKCVIGDVDGDRKADIIAFQHGSGGGGFGVYVSRSASSRSGGANFLPRVGWGDGFCFPGEVCTVGDVDGDGRADIIVFQHGGSGKAVYVGFSVVLANGTERFEPDLLHPGDFCLAGEHCAVGDVNGDRKADLIAFQYGKPLDPNTGVYVALSDGFGFVQKSNDRFCFAAESCAVGDANGDGKADIIAFEHEYTNAGVFVGLSKVPPPVFPVIVDRVRFSFDGKWTQGFCFFNEECAVGDVNGDRKADIIVFQRGATGTGVYVGLSEVWLQRWRPFYKEYLRFSTPFQKWHDNFCVWHRDEKSEYADQCLVGDVDGDGRTDIVAFNHGKAPGA